jgi:predicted transcriptional regulator of viral defense system
MDMKWLEVLKLIAREPVFTSSLLRAGNVSSTDLRVGLSRWVKAGRVIQLRRGVYALASAFRKSDPHPFLVANALRKNSYVSLQSALSHYGLIPEQVPVVTSVTTARPEDLRTELGTYAFRHIKPANFFGYRRVEVSRDQEAFVATPEKALLDLLYLTPGGERERYLRELRLQNTEVIDPTQLSKFSSRMGTPKVRRAAERILRILGDEKYEAL